MSGAAPASRRDFPRPSVRSLEFHHADGPRSEKERFEGIPIAVAFAADFLFIYKFDAAYCCIMNFIWQLFKTLHFD